MKEIIYWFLQYNIFMSKPYLQITLISKLDFKSLKILNAVFFIPSS